jgi:hypothetical protein
MVIGQNVGHAAKENGIHRDAKQVNIMVYLQKIE